MVSNSVKPGGNFVVLDLGPASWYNLRVTAHNNAGSTVAEYEFATLTTTGGNPPIKHDISFKEFSKIEILNVAGTIAPARETSEKDNPLIAVLMNLNLVVPAAAAILVIIAAIVVICVIKGRNNSNKGTSALFSQCRVSVKGK